MSRIGKMPIEIPNGVSVDIKDNEIKVKGPKGELNQKIIPNVNIGQEDSKIVVSVNSPQNKEQASLWGLYRSLVFNMVKGVTDGFEKKLEISGVGYKATVTGSNLVLNVGFSHPVEIPIPAEIEVKVEKNDIIVTGADKQVVGEVAAKIRKVRPVEPYKLKGIKYSYEQITKKAGKAAKGAGDAG
ncbi:50S ribosomal protein L6 [Candidatus Falkowbacteria bacterium]|nr:50S ribosomal protein L6 [Candidatus Falkowbacteria bacterium]